MFRPKDDSVQIGQDAFKIPCRNGTQFQEDSIIRFDIPRSAGFVDLANSYVSMEIELTNATNTLADQARQPMTQLDRVCGAQSLINQLTIRSEGRVLEELRNYNTFAHLHYNATETEGVMNRRSKLEGCAPSYMPQDNPYFTDNKVIAPVAALPAEPPITGLNIAADCYKPVRRKVLLPLLGGLFTATKAHPAMVMPLEVEMIMEKALRAMRVSSRGDNQITTTCEDKAGIAGGAPGDANRRFLSLNQRAQFNTPGGAGAPGIVPSNGELPLAGQQQLNKVNNCWWRVGQRVFVEGLGNIAAAPNYGTEIAGGIVCNITSVSVLDETFATAGERGNILLTFDNDLATGANVASTNLAIHQLNPLTNALMSNQGSIGYTIFNPQLVCQKVIPTPQVIQNINSAVAKGKYSVDIISYINIDNAIPATQTTSTNIISADLSRVKSILSVPTSQTATDDLTNSNAIQGQYLNATNYQYQINNKLRPDRRVDLVREQFPAVVDTPADNTLKPYRWGSHTGGFHRFELEKALRSSNIDLRNLTFITKNPYQLATLGINNNAINSGDWLVGRSLGAGVGTSENLVGKSVLLYLNYNANSNMVKLLKNFLIHVRTIAIDMSGVSVFY